MPGINNITRLILVSDQPIFIERAGLEIIGKNKDTWGSEVRPGRDMLHRSRSFKRLGLYYSLILTK